MKLNWKLVLAVVVIAAGATGLALNNWTRAQVVGVLKQFSQATAHGDENRPDKSWLEKSAAKTNAPWDRTLTLEPDQIKAFGLMTVEVKKQTEPWPLRLTGVTDYDPATVTIVRTQFDSRVDKVLVDLGSPVKVDAPLLELFSTDLAEAKSNYEVTISQHVRDKKVLDYKTPLALSNALPRKELIEVENDEAQSRLKMKLAKDKLLVYGLSEKEIESAKTEDGKEKAKMILRSRADGVVVLRNVVRGNYYTSADLLMTIAPLDHLWVRGSVSELDAELVKVGQKLKILFPFSDRTVDAKVEYIDKAIDSDSRSAKFRTSIQNPEGQIKALTFVKVLLEIPPKKGHTLIPRASMVSVDRSDYVFVKKPGKANQFERRRIFVAKESNDVVIVAEPSVDHLGLTPGEEVVTTGSLLLEQMYEDRVMAEGSLLVSRPGEGNADPFGHPEMVVVAGPTPGR
jgi:cobalt-zinc-cadmium efflux system membrane fusion protein